MMNRRSTALKIVSALMVLAMIPVFAACSALETEETTATTKPEVISITPQPASVAETVTYFNRVMDAVKTGKPAVAPDISKDVSNIECDNDKLKAAIPSLKDLMLNTDAQGSAYGEDATDTFPIKGQAWSSKLSGADVRYASCLKDGDFYQIIIRFKDEPEARALKGVIGNAFDIIDIETVKQEFKKAQDYMTVGDISLLYTGCLIKCTVERATDHVTSVTYVKNIDVKTSATGVGTLEAMGKVPVSFRYNCTSTYTLDWVDPATVTE